MASLIFGGQFFEKGIGTEKQTDLISFEDAWMSVGARSK